jgi:hypothetical protein
MVANKWKPGKTGNPSGKATLYYECLKLCRTLSPDAVQRLIELMRSDDDRVSYMSCVALLERAWGRSTAVYDPAADQDGQAQIDVRLLSGEERATLRAILEKSMGKRPTDPGVEIIPPEREGAGDE